jgi:hypothetical protein
MTPIIAAAVSPLTWLVAPMSSLTAVRDPMVPTGMPWVTGRLTGPPLQPSLVPGQAMLAAIFAALVLAIIVVCAGLLAHVALDRRRLGAWGAQWRATGPQWTRQR